MADKKKKTVKASDASVVKRTAKKLGINLLEDMTDAQLKKLAKDSSSKESLKAEQILYEREQKANRAYKDKILRDETRYGGEYGSSVGRKAREARAGVENMMEKVRAYNKKNKGATDMRVGGMVLSTTDNRKKK